MMMTLKFCLYPVKLTSVCQRQNNENVDKRVKEQLHRQRVKGKNAFTSDAMQFFLYGDGKTGRKGSYA